MANVDNDLTTLSDWFMESHTDSELHKLFVNMSATSKDLNALGYGIASFNFDDILVSYDDESRVKFNELNRLPSDMEGKRRIVSSEIFTMVMMQVGTYANCLQYVNSSSLVKNFASFVPFMPENDVMYYENIIKSYGAGETNCVYYCDYVRELENRFYAENPDLVSGGESDSKGNSYAKKGNVAGIGPITSDNQLNSAAYVSFVLIPISVAIAAVVFTILSWILA